MNERRELLTTMAMTGPNGAILGVLRPYHPVRLSRFVLRPFPGRNGPVLA